MKWRGERKRSGRGSKEEALTLSPSSSLARPPRQLCFAREERKDDGVSDEERIYIYIPNKKKGRFCDGAGERMMQAACKVNRLHPSFASLRQRFPQQPRCQEPGGAASCAVGGATSASSDPRRLLAFTPDLQRARARARGCRLHPWQSGLLEKSTVPSSRVKKKRRSWDL